MSVCAGRNLRLSLFMMLLISEALEVMIELGNEETKAGHKKSNPNILSETTSLSSLSLSLSSQGLDFYPEQMITNDTVSINLQFIRHYAAQTKTTIFAHASYKNIAQDMYFCNEIVATGVHSDTARSFLSKFSVQIFRPRQMKPYRIPARTSRSTGGKL